MFYNKRLLNFNDCLNQSSLIQRNVLLGNGFSIACNKGFQYNNIFHKSKLRDYLKRYFESCKQKNYESVIQNINYQAHIFKYCDVYHLCALNNMLKMDFIESLLEVHPKISNIAYFQKTNALYFLSNFSNIFTLNYDLLLYWVIMHGQILQATGMILNCYFDDGFGSSGKYACKWLNSSNLRRIQNVFYLHGAVHLFTENCDTYKIKYNPLNNQNIISTVKCYLSNKNSPLIVMEGCSYEKKLRIDSNSYLTFCYVNLQKIQGVLFIHGLSLNDNDMHIFDAINNNKNLETIYISVHESENLSDKIKKAKQIFPSKCLYYYAANSARIW